MLLYSFILTNYRKSKNNSKLVCRLFFNIQMDVGTQTEKSYVRNTRKPKEEPIQDAKPPEPPVQEIKNKILSCDFEVFGIVQGLF